MKVFIKELRKERGMTQKELAEKMQVSFQTVSKWENGVNLPDITHIPRLAEIFEVSSDVILGLEPMEKKSELRKFDSTEYWNENRELIKKWKALYWNDDYFEFLVKNVWGFRKPVDILDFGCGYGFLGMKLLPILPKGSSYTGVELDLGEIRQAKEYFGKTDYPYELIQQDIYQFQTVKKYDLVVALFLLSYMHNPETLIEKMKASLKPGGMLLLIDANMEVEQAGYFSGLENERGGLKRPDFIPLWEYEETHQERDYRMGTKLPYLLWRCGMKNIQARISDQVVIYQPADRSKKEMNDIFRYVYEHEDSYCGEMNYFTARGLSRQKADELLEYYKGTREYFNSKEALAVKTSGIYFVYAEL